MRAQLKMTLGMLVVLSLVTATTVAQEFNRFGDTALHEAAKTNNLSLVQELVEQGAVVDARNMHGVTPLMLATRRNSNPRLVQFHLDNGAEINARDNSGGITPLMYSVMRYPNLQVVELLL